MCRSIGQPGKGLILLFREDVEIFAMCASREKILHLCCRSHFHTKLSHNRKIIALIYYCASVVLKI